MCSAKGPPPKLSAPERLLQSKTIILPHHLTVNNWGLVTERNLRLLLQFGAEYSDVKNTQVRRITAERLLQSKTTIPHYYLTVDLNADKLLELRTQLNEKLAASGGKLSVNDFIVKASALVSWSKSFIFYVLFPRLGPPFPAAQCLQEYESGFATAMLECCGSCRGCQLWRI